MPIEFRHRDGARETLASAASKPSYAAVLIGAGAMEGGGNFNAVQGQGFFQGGAPAMGGSQGAANQANWPTNQMHGGVGQFQQWGGAGQFGQGNSNGPQFGQMNFGSHFGQGNNGMQFGQGNNQFPPNAGFQQQFQSGGPQQQFRPLNTNVGINSHLM